MSGDIATFVVAVDGDVETEKLNELFLLGESKEIGKVPGVILLSVNRWELSSTVDIAVDAASNVRELGDPTMAFSNDVALTLT